MELPTEVVAATELRSQPPCVRRAASSMVAGVLQHGTCCLKSVGKCMRPTDPAALIAWYRDCLEF